MKKTFTLIILLFAILFTVHAQQLSLVQFSSGYSSPVGIENCGDSRLFIVEEKGKIFICDAAGNRSTQPYLDITDRVLFSGERGLLGLAFDPNYKNNGFFYVNYINKSGNTQISRFKVQANNPNLANKNSEKFILQIAQPFSNHNGGCTRFGPDGYLYIGMGDGGSSGDPNNNAQNPMSLLGKMLRIDVHSGSQPYKIPADNPFVNSPNYKPEIWALGLRNPWRWSYDAVSGSMYIADVGQSAWEEIDIQKKGIGGNNYGWRCYEGKHEYNTSGCNAKSSYTFPVYEYFHADSTGDCSITGGFVYRGTKYPALYGKYIFTDYCSGLFRLLSTQLGRYRVKTVFDGDNGAYTSFGVDKNNEIYVTNTVNGNIYHITDGASLQNNVAENKSAEQNKLSFSPNPSNGNINITYTSPKTEQVTVRITNILGEQVYTISKTVNTGINTWNMNVHIPKGSYYLSIVNRNGSVLTQSLRIE
jgi:glucose/arabinose dehydrogenase